MVRSIYSFLALTCLVALGHPGLGSSGVPSSSPEFDQGAAYARDKPRSVPLRSSRPEISRFYTYTAGQSNTNQSLRRRVNFRISNSTPTSPSILHDFQEASDEIASLLRRRYSRLKPSPSAVREESVDVDEHQADLLQQLQDAFPNVNRGEPVVQQGCFKSFISGIKLKFKQAVECLTPCCRERDESETLQTDRKKEAEWASSSLEDVARKLETNFKQGLSSDHVHRQQETVGKNVLDKPKSTPFYEILWSAVNHAIVYLMFAGVLALFATKEFIEAVVMLLCVSFVVIMGTLPEYDATRQADNLAIEEPGQVQVLRDGEWKMIIATELVPGDVISLRLGDRVPADCRVIEGHDLNVAEAELTGESELLEKLPDAVTEIGKSGTYSNLIMMGTLVASGECTAVVVETGMRARYGSIQNLLIINERKSTPITDKVERLVVKFTKWTVAAAVVLGVISAALKRIPDPDSGENLYLQNFLLAIGLCIAVIPEGLPISCTLSLNKGMAAMLRNCNTRVRTMSAVECLSAIDVFCTDKTGTLTTGQMTVVGVYVPDNEFRILPDGQAVEGEISAVADTNQDEVIFSGEQLDLIMTVSALCNSAELLEDGSWQGQMSDVALARVAHLRHVDTKGFVKIATNTFDSKRKMMSVVVENNGAHVIFSALEGAPFVAIIKGAPEIVLNRCDDIHDSESHVRQLSPEQMSALFKRVEALSMSGYRVLALAYRSISDARDLSAEAVEHRMVFIGFIAIMDPLRESVPDTVTQLHRAGIAVKMITGDSILTATAIARQARILDGDSEAVAESIRLRECRAEVDNLKFKLLLCRYKLEADIKNQPDLLGRIDQYLDPGDNVTIISEALTQSQTKLDDLIDRTLVFARAQPEDKVTIVEALQRRKHIVAMTGDGVNDAPALKKADAGIAVYTATDLTKRAAPVNLLDPDFSRVAHLISEGRRVAHNMAKAVFCMFAGNVGELGPFFGQPFGLPPPLRTLQVLWLNANTDIFNIVPFSNDQPFHDLMLDRPVPPSAPVLRKWHWIQIVIINLTTTACAIAIELVTLYKLTRNIRGHVRDPKTGNRPRALGSSSTGVMTFMVLSQLLLSYTCRDLQQTAFGWYFFTNRSMHMAIIISTILTLAVPYIPKLSGWLSMHVMPTSTFIMALTLSLSLPLVHELLKAMFRIFRDKRSAVPKADPETPLKGAQMHESVADDSGNKKPLY